MPGSSRRTNSAMFWSHHHPSSSYFKFAFYHTKNNKSCTNPPQIKSICLILAVMLIVERIQTLLISLFRTPQIVIIVIQNPKHPKRLRSQTCPMCRGRRWVLRPRPGPGWLHVKSLLLLLFLAQQGQAERLERVSFKVFSAEGNFV